VKELLYPFQHGFQKGRCCATQLLEAFYDIGGALDRGIETDIISTLPRLLTLYVPLSWFPSYQPLELKTLYYLGFTRIYLGGVREWW